MAIQRAGRILGVAIKLSHSVPFAKYNLGFRNSSRYYRTYQLSSFFEENAKKIEHGMNYQMSHIVPTPSSSESKYFLKVQIGTDIDP